MTFAQRQNFMEVVESSSSPAPDNSDDFDDPFAQPPIGAEGVEVSHAGGEQEILEELQEDVARLVFRCAHSLLIHHSPVFTFYSEYKDHRTRADRMEVAMGYWQTQLPQLVAAFLAWRRDPWTPSNPWDSPVSPTPNLFPSHAAASNVNPSPPSSP